MPAHAGAHGVKCVFVIIGKITAENIAGMVGISNIRITIFQQTAQGVRKGILDATPNGIADGKLAARDTGREVIV
jgi:hypothetical protein